MLTSLNSEILLYNHWNKFSMRIYSKSWWLVLNEYWKDNVKNKNDGCKPHYLIQVWEFWGEFNVYPQN